MSNNLNKSNIELNFEHTNKEDLISNQANNENIHAKSKARTHSEQPKRNNQNSSNRPEDLFKSIESHVQQKFNAMSKKEAAALLNNIQNLPKQSYKLTKFSDTKFDNRHLLYNPELNQSLNEDLKMPLQQQDLTIPELHRRFKDEQTQEQQKESRRDPMRMTNQTVDSNTGVQRRQGFKKQFAKRPRSSSFRFDPTEVRKKSYSEWVDTEGNVEPEQQMLKLQKDLCNDLRDNIVSPDVIEVGTHTTNPNLVKILDGISRIEQNQPFDQAKDRALIGKESVIIVKDEVGLEYKTEEMLTQQALHRSYTNIALFRRMRVVAAFKKQRNQVSQQSFLRKQSEFKNSLERVDFLPSLNPILNKLQNYNILNIEHDTEQNRRTISLDDLQKNEQERQINFMNELQEEISEFLSNLGKYHESTLLTIDEEQQDWYFKRQMNEKDNIYNDEVNKRLAMVKQSKKQLLEENELKFSNYSKLVVQLLQSCIIQCITNSVQQLCNVITGNNMPKFEIQINVTLVNNNLELIYSPLPEYQIEFFENIDYKFLTITKKLTRIKKLFTTWVFNGEISVIDFSNQFQDKIQQNILGSVKIISSKQKIMESIQNNINEVFKYSFNIAHVEEMQSKVNAIKSKSMIMNGLDECEQVQLDLNQVLRSIENKRDLKVASGNIQTQSGTIWDIIKKEVENLFLSITDKLVETMKVNISQLALQLKGNLDKIDNNPSTLLEQLEMLNKLFVLESDQYAVVNQFSKVTNLFDTCRRNDKTAIDYNTESDYQNLKELVQSVQSKIEFGYNNVREKASTMQFLLKATLSNTKKHIIQFKVYYTQAQVLKKERLDNVKHTLAEINFRNSGISKIKTKIEVLQKLFNVLEENFNQLEIVDEDQLEDDEELEQNLEMDYERINTMTPDQIFDEKLIDLRSSSLKHTRTNKVPRKKQHELKNFCETVLNECKQYQDIIVILHNSCCKLWATLQLCEQRTSNYFKEKFFSVDLIQVKNFVSNIKQRLSRRSLGEQFFEMSQPLVSEILNDMESIENNLPILLKLQRTKVTTSQWKHVCMLLKKPDFIWREFKLQDILYSNFHPIREDIMKILENAEYQQKYLDKLKDLEHFWSTQEMQIDDLGHTFKVSNFEDIEKISEEHYLTAVGIEDKVTIQDSKAEVHHWIQVLEKIIRLIPVWRNLQNIYMENRHIYATDDIKQHLPEKQRKFYDVQMALQQIGKHAQEVKNAKKNLTVNGRLEIMYDLYERISTLKAEIEDQLFQMRLGQPRFFVLDNSQLMSMIVNFRNDVKNATFINYLQPCIKGLVVKTSEAPSNPDDKKMHRLLEYTHEAHGISSENSGANTVLGIKSFEDELQFFRESFPLEKSIESTLKHFELTSKSSIKQDISAAMKQFMVTALDEWSRDQIPQISISAFSTIITGEITSILVSSEIYNLKMENMKTSDDQVIGQVEFQSQYANQKQLIGAMENENLDNPFVKTIQEKARAIKSDQKMSMTEEEEISNTDDAQDPVPIPDLRDFKELPLTAKFIQLNQMKNHTFYADVTEMLSDSVFNLLKEECVRHRKEQVDSKTFSQKETFIKGGTTVKDLVRQSEAQSMITENTQEALMLRLKQMIKILTNSLSRNIYSNCLDPHMLTISTQDITQISSTLNVIIYYRDVLQKFMSARIFNSSDFEWKKIIKLYCEQEAGFVLETGLFKTNICQEYIGTESRFSLFPLTDKQWIQLTNSLAESRLTTLVNNQEGQATEIVNDFSAFLQTSVQRINCSSMVPMDLISNQLSISTLAKCHVVFHNFHRLAASVKIQLVKEFQILREGFLVEKAQRLGTHARGERGGPEAKMKLQTCNLEGDLDDNFELAPASDNAEFTYNCCQLQDNEEDNLTRPTYLGVFFTVNDFTDMRQITSESNYLRNVWRCTNLVNPEIETLFENQFTYLNLSESSLYAQNVYSFLNQFVWNEYSLTLTLKDVFQIVKIILSLNSTLTINVKNNYSHKQGIANSYKNTYIQQNNLTQLVQDPTFKKELDLGLLWFSIKTFLRSKIEQIDYSTRDFQAQILTRFKRCFGLDNFNSLSNKIIDNKLQSIVNDVKLKHYENLEFQKEQAYNIMESLLDFRSLVVQKLNDSGQNVILKTLVEALKVYQALDNLNIHNVDISQFSVKEFLGDKNDLNSKCFVETIKNNGNVTVQNLKVDFRDPVQMSFLDDLQAKTNRVVRLNNLRSFTLDNHTLLLFQINDLANMPPNANYSVPKIILQDKLKELKFTHVQRKCLLKLRGKVKNVDIVKAIFEAEQLTLLEDLNNTLEKEKLFMTELSLLDLFFEWFLSLQTLQAPSATVESDQGNLQRVIMLDALKQAVGSRLQVNERDNFNQKCRTFLEDTIKKVGLQEDWYQVNLTSNLFEFVQDTAKRKQVCTKELLETNSILYNPYKKAFIIIDESLKFAQDFMLKARGMAKNAMLIGDFKSGKTTVLDSIVDSQRGTTMVFKKQLGRQDREQNTINKWLLSKQRETDKQLINKEESQYVLIEDIHQNIEGSYSKLVNQVASTVNSMKLLVNNSFENTIDLTNTNFITTLNSSQLDKTPFSDFWWVLYESLQVTIDNTEFTQQSKIFEKILTQDRGVVGEKVQENFKFISQQLTDLHTSLAHIQFQDIHGNTRGTDFRTMVSLFANFMFVCKERGLKFKTMEEVHMYFSHSTTQLLSVLCADYAEQERTLQKSVLQCLKNNFGKQKITTQLKYQEVVEQDPTSKTSKRVLTYSPDERIQSQVRTNLLNNMDMQGAIFQDVWVCNNQMVDAVLNLATFISEPEKALCLLGSPNDGMEEAVKLLAQHYNFILLEPQMDMDSSAADLVLQVREAVTKCLSNPSTSTLLLLKSHSVGFESMQHLMHLPALKSQYSYIFDSDFKKYLVETFFLSLESEQERLYKIDNCLSLCLKLIQVCDDPATLKELNKDKFTNECFSFIKFREVEQEEISKTIEVFFEHKQIFLDCTQQLNRAIQDILADTRQKATIAPSNFNRKKIMQLIKSYSENYILQHDNYSKQIIQYESVERKVNDFKHIQLNVHNLKDNQQLIQEESLQEVINLRSSIQTLKDQERILLNDIEDTQAYIASLHHDIDEVTRSIQTKSAYYAIGNQDTIMTDLRKTYMQQRTALMERVGDRCKEDFKPITETFIYILIENQNKVTNFPHPGLLKEQEAQVLKNIKKCANRQFDDFDIYSRQHMENLTIFEEVEITDEFQDLIFKFTQSVCMEFVKHKLTRPMEETLRKNRHLLETKMRILEDKKSEQGIVSSKRENQEQKVMLMDEKQLNNKEMTLSIEANYVRSENLLAKILAVGENARKKTQKVQQKVDSLKGDCLIITLSMQLLGQLNQDAKSFYLKRWHSALTLNEVVANDSWASQVYEDQVVIYKETFVDKQILNLNHLDQQLQGKNIIYELLQVLANSAQVVCILDPYKMAIDLLIQKYSFYKFIVVDSVRDIDFETLYSPGTQDTQQIAEITNCLDYFWVKEATNYSKQKCFFYSHNLIKSKLILYSNYVLQNTDVQHQLQNGFTIFKLNVLESDKSWQVLKNNFLRISDTALYQDHHHHNNAYITNMALHKQNKRELLDMVLSTNYETLTKDRQYRMVIDKIRAISMIKFELEDLRHSYLDTINQPEALSSYSNLLNTLQKSQQHICVNIYSTHMTYQYYMQVLTLTMIKTHQESLALLNKPIDFESEYFSNVLMPSVYSLLGSNFSAQTQSQLAVYFCLEILLRNESITKQEQSFLKQQMRKQTDPACFITNGYFELNKSKLVAKDFHAFYLELKDIFMGENVNNLNVLEDIYNELDDESTLEDVRDAVKKHLGEVDSEQTLAKMLITAFCQDGQFFELIIELIGEAIGEMMVFDLNVISFNDVIKNCCSLVPITLLAWDDVNCISFMQKVSEQYQIPLSILRINCGIAQRDKYLAEKDTLFRALEECLVSGKWALLVLNNEHAQSFMMEVKKFLAGLADGFVAAQEAGGQPAFDLNARVFLDLSLLDAPTRKLLDDIVFCNLGITFHLFNDMLQDFQEYKSGGTSNPHTTLAHQVEYLIDEIEPYAELKKLQVMIERN